MATVLLYVDPIIGNDATGKPYIDGQPIYYYKTVDGAIKSVSNVGYIVIYVNKGTVEMNMISYKNITINKIDETAHLIINAKKGKSITMDFVILNINTTCKLPEDIVNMTGMVTADVPAIITYNLFHLTNGNNFNVADTFTGDVSNYALANRPRQIIYSNDLCLIDNMGGTIDLDRRDAELVADGIGIGINIFNSINTTDLFHLVGINKDEPLNFEVGNPNISQEWTITPLERGQDITSPKISKTVEKTASWYDKLEKVVGIVFFSVLATPVLGIIDLVSGDTTFTNTRDAFANVTSFAKKLKTTQSINAININDKIKSAVNKLQKLKNKKHPIRVKKFLSESIHKITNFSTDTNTVKVSGGTLINNSPDYIRASITNFPMDIHNVNLIDFKLFKEPNTNIEHESNYNITRKYNSYENSGSIFRLVKIISSDYIHTLDDGETFFVDASNNNITIHVPTDVLNNRLFLYKRIDMSDHIVKIITPKGIEHEKFYLLNNNAKYKHCNKHCNKCCNKRCKLKRPNFVRFMGYDGILWIVT